MGKWNVDEMWKGHDVYIIGGGPSILKQTGVPDRLATKIVGRRADLSAAGQYMTMLHDKKVIGCNNAYKLGEWIDIVYFRDTDWYSWHEEGLKKTTSLVVSGNQGHAAEPNVTYVPTVDKTGLSPKGSHQIYWNKNIGCSAIGLAYHLGAARIILLGFDMKMDDKGNSHSHGYHPEKPPQKGNTRHIPPFDSYIGKMKRIAQDAQKYKLPIINANPDSALECFPKMRLRDICES